MKRNFWLKNRSGLINTLFTIGITFFGILVSIFKNWNEYICLFILIVLLIYPIIYAIKKFNVNYVVEKSIKMKDALKDVIDIQKCDDDFFTDCIKIATEMIPCKSKKEIRKWYETNHIKGMGKRIHSVVKKYTDCESFDVLVCIVENEKMKVVSYEMPDAVDPPKGAINPLPINNYLGVRFDIDFINKCINKPDEARTIVNTDYGHTCQSFVNNNEQYKDYVFYPIIVKRKKEFETEYEAIGLIEIVSRSKSSLGKDSAALNQLANEVLSPLVKKITVFYNTYNFMTILNETKKEETEVKDA